MINFWKLAYETVKEQRDQHKVELQECKSELHYYKAELESYKTNLKQRKEALEYTRDEVKKFKAENEKLKAERDKFEKMLNKECECGYKLEGQLHDMTKQRDTLIDDLSWYKAKVSRLEREIKEFDKDYEMVTNNCIYWEDKAHWLEDESSKYINLLSEFSQHIGNKPSSSTYKYFRAKLDGIGIKEVRVDGV